MKYRNSLLLVFAFYVLTACGQTSEANRVVEVKVDALYEAMVEKDEATLINLTAENLSYGHSSGNIEDRAQFIEAVMNGPFDYLSIIPEDQKIILSGDVALVRHIFVTNALNDGKPVDVRIGNLMTFQKQNGEWKLLGRQAYKLQ